MVHLFMQLCMIDFLIQQMAHILIRICEGPSVQQAFDLVQRGSTLNVDGDLLDCSCDVVDVGLGSQLVLDFLLGTLGRQGLLYLTQSA